MLLCGCTSVEREMDQRREQLHSLASTTTAIAEAWLEGRVSGTYARTAFRQTYVLVEQQRSALVASPRELLRGEGPRLAQTAEQLARVLARLMQQVFEGNGDAVRRSLRDIPDVPSKSR
jgi:hypothetical protein